MSEPKKKFSLWAPFRDILTEKDGVSYDFVRVFGAIGILWYMACVTYAVFKGQAFDAAAVSMGLSTLIISVAGGVAVRAFSNSEADVPK